MLWWVAPASLATEFRLTFFKFAFSFFSVAYLYEGPAVVEADIFSCCGGQGMGRRVKERGQGEMMIHTEAAISRHLI